jgi:hypothetical protein
MPKAVKCVLSAPHARLVKAAANVANAGAKAGVNVANALSAARQMPTMPVLLNRPWVQTRRQTPTPQPKVPAQLKTMNAANAARVTVTAATAVNALARHDKTQ